MANATTSGGAAAIGGFSFQSTLAAWASCGVLAEQAASSRWELAAGVYYEFIKCEAEQPLDDLMIGTSNGGHVFLQVTTNITCSNATDSKLASALEQCVRQFHAYHSIGDESWERPLEPHRDRLVIATDSDAPQWLKTRMPVVLGRFRQDDSIPSLIDAATSQQDRNTATVIQNHVVRVWQAEKGATPSSDQLRKFFSLLRLNAFDLSTTGVDRIAAMDTLRQAVLIDPAGAETTFTLLMQYCTELATQRTGATRPELQRYLQKQSPPIHLNVPISFARDIDRVKSKSRRTAEQLADLAIIRVRDDQEPIKITRLAVETLSRAIIGECKKCLVVGEPGAGKSGVVHDLVNELVSQKRDVVYLAADHLAASNEEQHQSEWQLDHTLYKVLQNWPGHEPAYLVIDALDAARSEVSAKFLRDLLQQIIHLECRWRVVVSIRKFDLRYGHALQELFAGEPIGPPRPDPEFATLRHLNVVVLRDDELEQVAHQSTELATLLTNARGVPDSALLDLLRNPFNLRLAASLIACGIPIDELTPLSSQIELLERYWAERVLYNDPECHAREEVCRLLCEDMAQAKSLQADASVIPSSSSAALQQLKRHGVLIEWQVTPLSEPDRNVLAFAHNVLFDFAVARALFRGTGDKVKNRMVAEPGIVLALQPSFSLHYQHLWRVDPTRRQFWSAVLGLQTSDIPKVGQLIGPAVCIDVATDSTDLKPLIAALDDATDQAAAESVIAHMAGALLAKEVKLVGDNPGPWCEWLRDVSDRLSDRTAGSVRAVLIGPTRAADHRAGADSEMTPTQGRLINHASRRLFEFALATPASKSWLLPNAVIGVCRTFRWNTAQSTPLLEMLLDADDIRKGQLDGLRNLVNEISALIEYTPELVAQTYRTVFAAEEPPDEQRPMWESQIVPLVTSVRQDFQMLHYGLGEAFGEFLKVNPAVAIPVLCDVVERYAARRHRYGNEAGTHQFSFRGTQAAYSPDASACWDDRSVHKHDAPVKMLKAFSESLDDMVSSQDGEQAFLAYLDYLAGSNRLAVVWRRILEFGAANPNPFGLLLQELVQADVVLATPDTRVQAGELLKSTYHKLDEHTRERIETTITEMPTNPLCRSSEYGERVRDRLLGCLPEEHLVTEAAKARYVEFLASGGAPSNEPDFSSSLSWGRADGDWYLEDQERRGIPIREAQNMRLREAFEPLSDFRTTFLNERPTTSNIDAIWSDMETVTELVSSADSDGVHTAIKNDAIGYLAEVCECIVLNDSALDDVDRCTFLRESLLRASTNEVPEFSEEGNESFDRSPHWGSPSARIHAAEGLALLCRSTTPSNSDVLDAVQRLSEDRVHAVRYMVARRLGCLYSNHPTEFWKIAERFASSDESSVVLQAFVDHCLSRLPKSDGDRVLNLVETILERVGPKNGWPDVQRSALLLILRQFVRDKHLEARRILFEAISNPVDLAAELASVPGNLREPLAFGLRTPLNESEPGIRERAWEVVRSLTAATVKVWNERQAEISKKLKDDPNWTMDETTQDQQKSLYHLIDCIGNELYFASGAYDDKQSERAGGEGNAYLSEGRRAFYRNAESVVRHLLPLGLAGVSHHLVEYLHAFVDVDPEQVFLLIGDVVMAAEQGGYASESLAVDLIVKIVERYLAEYRHVLRESEQCQEMLIRVLDVFVTWPSARKLAYRLGEIYR